MLGAAVVAVAVPGGGAGVSSWPGLCAGGRVIAMAEFVSDADREQAIRRLAEAAGRDLSLAQYEQRLESVLEAATAAELAEVLADLPEPAAPRRQDFAPALRRSVWRVAGAGMASGASFWPGCQRWAHRR